MFILEKIVLCVLAITNFNPLQVNSEHLVDRTLISNGKINGERTYCKEIEDLCPPKYSDYACRFNDRNDFICNTSHTEIALMLMVNLANGQIPTCSMTLQSPIYEEEMLNGYTLLLYEAISNIEFASISAHVMRNYIVDRKKGTYVDGDNIISNTYVIREGDPREPVLKQIAAQIDYRDVTRIRSLISPTYMPSFKEVVEHLEYPANRLAFFHNPNHRKALVRLREQLDNLAQIGGLKSLRPNIRLMFIGYTFISYFESFNQEGVRFYVQDLGYGKHALHLGKFGALITEDKDLIRFVDAFTYPLREFPFKEFIHILYKEFINNLENPPSPPVYNDYAELSSAYCFMQWMQKQRIELPESDKKRSAPNLLHLSKSEL